MSWNKKSFSRKMVFSARLKTNMSGLTTLHRYIRTVPLGFNTEPCQNTSTSRELRRFLSKQTISLLERNKIVRLYIKLESPLCYYIINFNVLFLENKLQKFPFSNIPSPSVLRSFHEENLCLLGVHNHDYAPRNIP